MSDDHVGGHEGKAPSIVVRGTGWRKVGKFTLHLLYLWEKILQYSLQRRLVCPEFEEQTASLAGMKPWLFNP
jgi:hypothetical protein